MKQILLTLSPTYHGSRSPAYKRVSPILGSEKPCVEMWNLGYLHLVDVDYLNSLQS